MFQQPPKCFNIFIVISDIWIVHVNPISHTFCQVAPFCRVFHHILTTFLVVFLYRYFRTDICLCYTKVIFHAQFNWQSVSIPSSLTVYLIPLHCLISVKRILDCSRKNMVYTWMPVGRWRSLVEYKFRTSFSFFYRTVEHVKCVPFTKYFVICLSKI